MRLRRRRTPEPDQAIAMEQAGFAKRTDGVWHFVGYRAPDGAPLAWGFERDNAGVVRYVGGPVDNYNGAGSVDAALARWKATP